MDKPKEKRVVSIAPFDKDGRLLMGKRRDTNKWCFPGGKLEGNEKPEKGAIRELVEESALKPSELTYLGEGMAGKSGNVRVFSYSVKVTGEPTSKYDPDNEFMSFKWFDPEDGLPKEIEDNLYNPKDITLRLLGLQEGEDLNKAVIDPTKNPNFNKWFEGSKAVDHAGNPKTVYHGTTHKFHTFTNKKGNPENHYGTAHYFTDSPEDVSHNYAGQGPDLTRRIENEAERIYSSSDSGNMDYEDAKKIARRNLIGNTKGHVIPAYLHMKNPIVVEPKGGTRFSLHQETDENGDPVGAEEGNGLDLLEAIHNIAWKYDVDPEGIINQIHEHAPLYEDPTAHEVEQAIRNAPSLMDMYTPDGNSAGSEFIQRLYRELGHDGVIMDAYAAFGPKKLMGYGPSIGGMPHVSPGTKHYVVFEPNQIKSIFNKNFNPRAKNFGKAEYDSWSDIVRPQIENESYSFPQRDPTHNPEFNKWFEDSKAVHWEKDPTHKPRYSNDIQYRPTTKPLTAFHGTKKDFSIFNSNRQNSPDKYAAMSNWAGELGSWFTAPSKHPGNCDEGNAEGIAEGFTDNRSGDPDVGARVTPVHLSIKNPAEFYDHEDMMDEARPHKSWKKFRTHLESKGHDGIVIRNSMTDGDADRDDWIAFHPHQIKSAVGNNGQFNVNDPDITKSERETPDQITRMQQHPSAIERRMALKLAGVNAHHISTGLHDPDKEVRTAALKHPLFDSKHIDEVFDTHDNDMISEALHSPHVRIDHLDRAWPFEPLKDIVINHPKLTADHINRFMEDADNSRKIELLNHPNIDSSVINNVYTQNIDKANHGETNYLFLNSLANPQLSQEHLNEALHSPIPQIQLNAARNPNISQAEIEKLLLDDRTSRELRNLLISKHKE